VTSEYFGASKLQSSALVQAPTSSNVVLPQRNESEQMWLAEGHRKLKLARCDAPMKFGAVTLNRTLTRNLLPSNERNVTQVLGETLMQTSDCGRNYQIVKVLATDCT